MEGDIRKTFFKCYFLFLIQFAHNIYLELSHLLYTLSSFSNDPANLF